MSDRLPCTARGCSNTILPATAARTGGICRPCEQRIWREEHEAYVRENRREVDPYAGVTGPVEVVTILMRPPSRDELVVEKPFPEDADDYFARLEAEHLQRLAALAVSWLDERETEAEKLARCLAAFTTADLTTLQQAWIDAGRLGPAIVFRDAPQAVCRRLVAMVEDDRAGRHDVLLALAWIGNLAVVDLFARWRARPPAWSAELQVPLLEYPPEGGWELDANGGRRELYHRVAHALLPSAAAAGGERRKPDKCPWCKSRLWTLLRLNDDDPRLQGLDLPGRIVTCPSCGSYGPIFMSLPAPDRAVWHPRNQKPAYGPFDPDVPPLPADRIRIGRRRSALHAADPFLPTSLSQVGGAPGWIQRAEFPSCPGCARTMIFVSQLCPGEWNEDADGCFYAFWCSSCRVTATLFQHT